ncbi:DUF4330 domain-containing protein [Halopenitus persicus]|uniref:DUF4330 domain-containing protein n=1 Tax=Halopenitus persicus TaxID=1048396 RepID=A0A1H3IXT8_9EURY|nr:DUF4330 domain-containing protein [Halopenitus persicus]SDY32135.1 protein of unknown function [Halopenitus persicus]
MELIDDEGNLLGVVNVVDALAVLLVLAVVVAGAALVLSDDPAPPEPETETTYATLDLGTQQPAIADAINEGDVHEPSDTQSLTVTDVHLTPRGNGVGVLARVEIQGTLDDDGDVTYGDAPLRLGRSLSIATDRYQVKGSVRSVGDSDAIDRAETRVVLQETVAATTAEAVAPGDEVRIAGRTVATIEEAVAYTTAEPGTRRLRLVASLDAHRHGGDLRFGGTPLRTGQTLTLPAEDYQVAGTVERVGPDVGLGDTTTRRVTLRMDGVREDFAERIDPGMAERTGGETVAEVTAVDAEPAIIIATGDDGSVNVVDHPVERDVTITADLQVRETSTGLRFKGESIRQGSTVVLDLGAVTVEATVASVGS